MKNFIALIFCVLTSIAFGQNDNPYSKFGYEGNILKTPQERLNYMLIIPNQDTLSIVKKIGIEPKHGKYYLFDIEDNIVFQDTLTREQTSRFFSVDPLSKDYPHYSPYQFSGNDVIRSVELEGLEPKIIITKNTTGFTNQTIYGSRGRPTGAKIVVPTYKMILIDAQNPNEILGTYNVTRDAWYSRGKSYDAPWYNPFSSDEYELTNRAFEPANGNRNLYTGVVKPFPTSELYAYELTQGGDKRINAESFTKSQNTYLDGSLIDDPRDLNHLDIASSVMVHIGGEYKPTANSSIKLAGSYGCFGFVCDAQVFNSKGDVTTGGSASNDEYNEFVQTVANIREKYKGTPNYKVLITVEKRKDVQTKKTVND